MGTTSKTVKPKKLKSKRDWLEKQHQSGSHYVLTVYAKNGHVELGLADCHRSINWTFGKPNSPRAVAKITKLKKLVDEMHAHLVDSTAPPSKDDEWD